MKDITVTLTRGALTIKECPVELAESLFVTRSMVTFEDGLRQTGSERLAYAHYDAQTRQCRTYPNALTLVQKAADKLQLPLKIQDQRLRPALNQDNVRSGDGSEMVQRLLAKVARAGTSGIVLLPAQVEITQMIQGLIRLLPSDFKVLVTVDGVTVARHVYASLASVFKDEKPGIHVRASEIRSRVMITCLDQLADFAHGDLAYSGYALRDFDVWICDEAHRAADPALFPLLGQFRTVFAWGLTAHPSRADNSHHLLEVIFGPAITDVNLAKPTTAGGERLFVFPLTTAQPLPHALSPSEKFRVTILQNPAFLAAVQGIDANLPQSARTIILVDSHRLAVLLRRQLPHCHLVDVRKPGYQLETFAGPVPNEARRLLMLVSRGQKVELPQADYILDCTMSGPVNLDHRAHRIMFLSLDDEFLFDGGLAKINRLSALGWQVNYMFERQLAESLSFTKAALVAELGTFP